MADYSQHRDTAEELDALHAQIADIEATPPEPLEFLSEEALAEWGRRAHMLADGVDVAILTVWCEAWGNSWSRAGRCNPPARWSRRRPAAWCVTRCYRSAMGQFDGWRR